jgi:hypothetical protein
MLIPYTHRQKKYWTLAPVTPRINTQPLLHGTSISTVIKNITSSFFPFFCLFAQLSAALKKSSTVLIPIQPCQFLSMFISLSHTHTVGLACTHTYGEENRELAVICQEGFQTFIFFPFKRSEQTGEFLHSYMILQC